MIFFTLISFSCIFIVFTARSRRATREIRLLARLLAETTEALLVNDLQRINSSPVTSSPSSQTVSQLLKKYLYSGVLRVDKLRLLQRVVTSVQEQQELVQQIRLLFSTRIGAVLIISMLGNFLLSQVVTVSPYPYQAVVAVGVLLVSGFLLLEKTIPNNWFWCSGITASGREWIGSLFNPTDYSFHKKLQEMRHREMVLGIDLAKEKTVFLTNWCAQQEVIEKAKFKRHQDLFPLLELFFFSLLVVIQLFPVLHGLITLLHQNTL